jgi:hypothetical protein
MEKYNEKNPSNVYEKFHGIPWNSMEFHEIHGTIFATDRTSRSTVFCSLFCLRALFFKHFDEHVNCV